MKTLLFYLLLGLSCNYASCQVSGASALLVLDEIDATVSKQLQSIDNLATNAIGNTGNMMLSVSSRLRKDIDDTIGNTDKVLRENQMLLYNQLMSLSVDFEKIVAGQIQETSLITTRVAETLDNFIVKKKEPRIYKYDTQPFIQGYTGYYYFKVRGKNFDKSDAITININGKKIAPTQYTYQDLNFKIDSSDIKSAGPGIYYANAEISFTWRKGLFNKKVVTKVPFIIPLTPLNIGNATVFYEQQLPEKKYSDDISYSCGCRTGATSWTGSRRRSSTAFNILPTGGRLIDPNSVAVVYWHQRYGGGYGFDHKTEQQIRGDITCISQARPSGGGGSSSLTFTYKEFEIVYPIHKNQTTSRTISSINPLIFELPDSVDNKRPNLSYAVIKTFDNKEHILSPTNPNRFFDIRINPVTDDVVISWKN